MWAKDKERVALYIELEVVGVGSWIREVRCSLVVGRREGQGSSAFCQAVACVGAWSLDVYTRESDQIIHRESGSAYVV